MAPPTVALYDNLRGRHAYLRDAYLGGEHYAQPSSTTLGSVKLYGWERRQNPEDQRFSTVEVQLGSARSYLVPYPGEGPVAFAARHNLAVHVPVVQPIVDAYADASCGRTVRTLGALEPYLKNLDGQGSEWADVVEDVAGATLLHGWVATVADAPAMNPARSLLEEERLGIMPRCIVVTPAAIAWIILGDQGALEEFAYVDTPFSADPQVGAAQTTVRFFRWTRDGWDVRDAGVSTSAGLGAQRATILTAPVLREGELSRTLRGEVPVRFAFHRRVTDSRWPLGVGLVNDIVDVERAVYNSMSAIGDLQRKTSFAFLALPTKDGSLDPQLEVRVGPDAPMPFAAQSGQPGWIEPEGRSITSIREQVVFDLALAYRSAGMEITMDQSASPSSGLALQVRSRDFESRCGKFAKKLARWDHGMLDLFARMLGKKPDFHLQYPRRFVLEDSQESLARAILVYESLAKELGPKALEAVLRQALGAATALSDEEVDEAMEEIRAKIEKPAAAAPKPAPFGGPPAPRPPVPPPGDGPRDEPAGDEPAEAAAE